MSEECSHDCQSCQQDCGERESMLVKQNGFSDIKKVIAVVSGKGGVGKSFVTAQLASLMNRRKYQTAVLDADVTGPSIPKAFGIKDIAQATEMGIMPIRTKSGIDIMSVNLLLADETEPVIWRGPVISGVVTQFWTDVLWSEVDYMFVDMPPGTGDVALTVFQSLPLDGIIIVTSPQELVSMIVKKAVNMANEMDIPVLGIVENMSYFDCPDCHTKHFIFGESNVDAIAKQYGIKTIAKLPINPDNAKLTDMGKAEDIVCDELNPIADMLEKL